MMLVAMVPFLIMAQKKAKKRKNVKTEKVVESNSSYDFMVITGYEITFKAEDRTVVKSSKPVDLATRGMVKNKLKIAFDFGSIKNPENINLMKNARRYMTMAAAVNGAANEGWEFISANVVNGTIGTTHHYYMKRNK